VVRDIAADYQENALRLLGNLNTRHRQEQADTMASLRKASRDSFSVFSGAGQDMGVLLSRLREMDVNHTADTLMQPVLAHKLDAVTRLCQKRLDNCTENGALEDGSITDSEDSLDNLSETYRVRLCEAVRRSDDASDVPGKANLQVDDFIMQCLRGETKKVHRPQVKPPGKGVGNANAALEVFLDGIINTLQEKGGRDDLIWAENAVDLVSEDSAFQALTS